MGSPEGRAFRFIFTGKDAASIAEPFLKPVGRHRFHQSLHIISGSAHHFPPHWFIALPFIPPGKAALVAHSCPDLLSLLNPAPALSIDPAKG